MEHSDGWNCLYGTGDTQPQLVQTVANTIVQNTSGPKEANDFWSRAELNLLMALIHYVVNLRDANGNLLPIEQRGLGDVYRMIATESIEEINRKLAALFAAGASGQGPPRPLPESKGKPLGQHHHRPWQPTRGLPRSVWWIRSPATTMLTSCCPASGPVCTLSSSPRRTARTAFCPRFSSHWLCRSFPTLHVCNVRAGGCRC